MPIKKLSTYYFLVLFLVLKHADIHAQPVLHRIGEKSMVLENAQVKMSLTDEGDSGVHRKFFARTKSGGWKLMAGGFIPHYTSPTDSTVLLWNMNFNPYRHVVTAIPGEVSSSTNTGDPSIQIRMMHHSAAIEEKISLHANDNFFHIEVHAVLPDTSTKIDNLLSTYSILDPALQHPDFVQTPGVKFDDSRSGKGRDQITGDRAFMAPAVILEQQQDLIALVPDLNAINHLKVTSKDARRHYIEPAHGPFTLPFIDRFFTMPTGIDLNFHSGITKYPLITYGLMDAMIGFHTRFVRKEDDTSMIRTLDVPRAGYAFDLFLSASMPPEGYQQIAQYQWQQYGHPLFQQQAHLAMPLKEYVRLVNRTIFYPIRDSSGGIVQTPGGAMDEPVKGYPDRGSWLEWESNGIRMGGFRCSAPFWNDVINNSPFWNQARDAVGMYYWGRELKDDSLLNKARLLINFCLSAPRNKDGLFATVYSARDSSWGIGWSDPPHNKNVLFLRNSDSYEIPALCKTGAHLLDYYLRAEKDQRIIRYLYPFANWLVGSIDQRGIVPSYVTKDMTPSSILYESAQPAAALWFLAEMYNATHEQKFISGAERIAAYLEREIIPTAKWIDMEQYVSCGAKPYSYIKDYWQNQWFRGTLCTIWATEGFAALHRATGNKRWLLDGAKCADYLSFSQCIWRPHYIYTANPFGGFVSDNSDDANMLDQREAEVAKPFIYLGKALARQDLIERGVAAAQASCTLIIHPRHIANNIFPHPLFYPVGVAPENIDHEGLPQCPMRTHPLWGEGSAVFTGLSEVYRSLGGLYVNPRKDLVVGVDGIRVLQRDRKENTLDIKTANFLSSDYLPDPWTSVYPTDVRIDQGKNYQVIINENSFNSSDSSIYKVLVQPNGSLKDKMPATSSTLK